MRVVIVLEQRFLTTPDGAIWTPYGRGRDSWGHYLQVFAGLTLLARVGIVAEAEPSWHRVDVDGIDVIPLPHYVGPAGYMRQRGRVAQAIRGAVAARASDAWILRVPSVLAGVAWRALVAARRPFGVEVLGDPWDVLAPGAVRHVLAPLLRPFIARELRRQCAGADVSLYVTEAALQRRYPPVRSSASGDTFGVSDVELDAKAFSDAPRDGRLRGPRTVVVCVGTLEQLYKRQDVLLEAAALCVRGGIDCEVVLVGDGRQRPHLAGLARRLGIQDRVRFAGQLPAGERVRRELDAADLFVLPSRQEGMPRALLEAMARGLPCVASSVGGIPEVLSPEFLVAPGDARGLAGKMALFCRDPAARARASRENWTTAGRFREENLWPRRLTFLKALEKRTSERTGRSREP